MDLEGATNVGHVGARPVDAGEFAARWNQMTPEDREYLLSRINRFADESAACFAEDHRGRLRATWCGKTETTEHGVAVCDQIRWFAHSVHAGPIGESGLSWTWVDEGVQ